MTADDYARGLRALADWIEAHLDLPAHFAGGIKVSLYPESDTPEIAARLARAMKPVEKKYGEGENPLLTLTRDFGGAQLNALFWRNKVCQRVVTGTRKVVEEVPDPALLERVPLVEVEREEEIVEWICEPLLAAGTEVRS